MKTLNQIEPRTPISAVPYTIWNPGSYYLTTNLTCNTHGVIIMTDNVTVDLMGFTLSGDRNSSDYGIFLAGATNSTIRQVFVHNGIVRNFGRGLYAAYAQNSRFEQLLFADNFLYGIYLDGSSGRCDGNTIANCTVSGTSGRGIYLDGKPGQCDGNTIADCTVRGNLGHGIELDGSTGRCDGNTIIRCAVSSNSDVGIVLQGSVSGQCDGNTIANCTVHGNGSSGIYLAGSTGQCEGNRVVGCTIQKNTNRGISLYYAYGNRLEGNYISGQTGTTSYGIYCDTTTKNLIVRNVCVGQTNNFRMVSSDTYGPIVTNSGALSGTDPWANFSR
jgi:parallel beta-helix repeat protein